MNSASFSCFSRPAQWHSEKRPINQWMLGLSLRTHRAVLLLCCWGGIQLGVGVCRNWPVSEVDAVVLTYHTVLATAAKKFSVHKCKLASTFTRPKMQMKMCFFILLGKGELIMSCGRNGGMFELAFECKYSPARPLPFFIVVWLVAFINQWGICTSLTTSIIYLFSQEGWLPNTRHYFSTLLNRWHRPHN